MDEGKFLPRCSKLVRDDETGEWRLCRRAGSEKVEGIWLCGQHAKLIKKRLRYLGKEFALLGVEVQESG